MGNPGSVQPGLTPFPVDPVDPPENSGRLDFVRRRGTGEPFRRKMGPYFEDGYIKLIEKKTFVLQFNDDEKILEILSELIRDLKNYELEIRIEELESRFSKDLSEVTFNELKELKKLQKIN